MIYRYMNDAHVARLRSEGTIRIRPLVAYRSTGDSRQDHTEALITRTIPGPGRFSRDESKLIFGRDNSIELGFGGTLRLQLHLADGYVLCFSKALDASLMTRFSCNSVMEVTDPQAFAAMLSRALADIYGRVLGIHGDVSYDRSKKMEELSIADVKERGEKLRQTALADYFVKPPEYATEEEYRFVFLVDSKEPLEDLSLTVPMSRLLECCAFPCPPRPNP